MKTKKLREIKILKDTAGNYQAVKTISCTLKLGSYLLCYQSNKGRV